ncbi:MAG: S49 family peptidase, partial [Cyanobacteria bacterium J06555_13]
ILAFDRPLTPAEETILQELIDVSYGQFVRTVAEGRNLPEEKVREFADGRVFTGEQALAFGMVDRLGSEEDARRWAAELGGLDPDKAECYTFEEKKPLLSRLLPGNQSALSFLPAHMPATMARIEFEVATSGMPLWIYQPPMMP